MPAFCAKGRDGSRNHSRSTCDCRRRHAQAHPNGYQPVGKTKPCRRRSGCRARRARPNRHRVPMRNMQCTGLKRPTGGKLVFAPCTLVVIIQCQRNHLPQENKAGSLNDHRPVWEATHRAEMVQSGPHLAPVLQPLRSGLNLLFCDLRIRMLRSASNAPLLLLDI